MSTDIALISNPDEIAQLPAEQQAVMVTHVLAQAKSWLDVAVKGTDPRPLKEFKAFVASIAEITRQKELAEDIQLDAQEMVRRADRGLGLAIRNGQDAGTVRTRSDNARPDASSRAEEASTEKLNPSDFFSGGGHQSETYAMTDGISDEDFDEVLADARAEKNLTRANVVRKSRARSGIDHVIKSMQPEEDSPVYTAEVGAPTCAPVVFREELLSEIRTWAAAGSELVTRLSLYERDEMVKALVRLDKELRSVPAPQFKETQ